MDMTKCPMCGTDTYLDLRGGSELRGCACGWRMVERHPVDAGKGLGAESIPVLMEEIGKLREAMRTLEIERDTLRACRGMAKGKARQTIRHLTREVRRLTEERARLRTDCDYHRGRIVHGLKVARDVIEMHRDVADGVSLLLDNAVLDLKKWAEA